MTAVSPSRAAPSTVAAADRRRRAGLDAAVRVGSGAGLWLSLLVVTYWWAAEGGFQGLTGWETALTSLGRITGLIGADLLLAQVLLIARPPVLERAFGQDKLIMLHRPLGLISVNLMVAHIVLITWGYAGGRLLSTPGTFWNLTIDYPGMLLAVAGTACLVMVVVTSVRAARSRLRYESWHLLHLYAYLGVGLALPHQLWTGRELLTSTVATVYWWSLWGLAAGATVMWRIALPLWRSARHRLYVTSVVSEGDGIVSVYMTGRGLHRLPAQAGQFCIWRFPNRPGWTRGNPYSLSAAPDGRSLRITVKELGDGSARIRALHPGTPVLFEGPYGRLTAQARTRRRVAFIGAGVGVTPLRALAEGLDYAPGDAVLLQRFTGRPLFERELNILAHERGLRVLWLPGRRRSHDSWLGEGIGTADDVTALRFWVPDIAERDVYVCGPMEWTQNVRRAAEAAGLPPERFHVENFSW